MIWKIVKDYKLIYFLPLLLFFALVYKFFLSQGTWHFFEYNQGQFYNWLAQGFLEGRLGVAKEIVARGPFGDGAVFNHNIFLTWGPFPALIHAFVIILTGKGIFGTTLTYWFSLANLIIFWFLLTRLSLIFFKKNFFWIIIPIFIAYASGPLLFNIGRGYVYEESIAIASTFLLSSILWLTFLVDKRSQKNRTFILLISSIFFSLAILTRFTLVFYFPTIFAFAIIFLCSNYRLKITRANLFLVAALILPTTLAIFMQFTYNWARFKSPTEFGIHYQIAGNPKDLNRLKNNQTNSYKYITYNFKTYFVSPIFLNQQGRLIRSNNDDVVGDFPKLTVVHYSNSIFFASPILIWSFFSLLLIIKKEKNQLFYFLVSTQLGLLLFLVFGLLNFQGSAARYIQDFIPFFYFLSFLTIVYFFKGFSKLLKAFFLIFLLFCSVYSFILGSKLTCSAWMNLYKPGTAECRSFYRPTTDFIPLSYHINGKLLSVQDSLFSYFLPSDKLP